MRIQVRLRSLTMLAMGVALLPACTSSMLETAEYDWTAGVGNQRCSSGVYYLPKRLLTFQVSLNATGNQTELEFLPKLDADLTPVSDPRLPLCLDYLAAPTADDKVVIDRTADGLLKSIYANAVDKSQEIVGKLIDVARLAAVAGGSRSRRYTSKFGTAFLAKFQMDPFDVTEAAATNDALKGFGFCVYVEGFTFDPNASSPEAYCRNPRDALHHRLPHMGPINTEILLSESRRGVLYRPNLLHDVVVMRKLDPDGPDRWRPWQRQKVEMPNVAPIFSIGVTRTYFTERTTKLTFDFGVLRDVVVTKGSELNSIAELPLKVAQAVVSIPTEIVQVRINQVNNETALIAAQSKLLGTYRDFTNEQKLYANAVPQGLQQCLQAAGADQVARSNCMMFSPSPSPPPSSAPVPTNP